MCIGVRLDPGLWCGQPYRHVRDRATAGVWIARCRARAAGLGY